ncbi:MAG TPA: AbrB/MazE/SpoVT family DNA-binding domain-containing protein [Gammaproteobacteria bacterium]|nr:AbrB/MazE/SpoVT family DNA-binding domain-containing protein [Gammaproteobacteria bacterium]
MPIATLRSVGGSVVMAIPKRVLELVHLQSGSQVTIDVQDGKLIIEPSKKPKYTLAELMAQCDLSQPLSADEQEWLSAPSVGAEEL